MNKYAISAVPAMLLFLGACGGKATDKKKTATRDIGDSTKYVFIEDAKEFLPGWSAENSVINHWMSEPQTLHPTNENNAGRNFVFQYTQSYLLVVDHKTLELAPDLAKTLPKISADGLSYEYELRENAVWDDGAPVTAEDVIFTYKVNKCLLTANPFAKSYLEELQDIRPDASNPRKFTIVMGKKYLLNDYLTTDFAIMQRKFFDPSNVMGAFTFAQISDPAITKNTPKALATWANDFNGAKFGTDLAGFNGAGPYKVESWDRGQTIVLSKKAGHWTENIENPIAKHTAFPEKIYFKTVTDDNAIQLEFKKQGLDVSTWLTTKSMLAMMEDTSFMKNYHAEFVQAFNFAFIAMNNRPDGTKHKKLFTDKKVRLAMTLLTPVQDVIDVVYFGKAKPQAGPVNPIKKEFNKDLKPYAHDIERAKQLLNEAGWTDSDGDNILDKMIDGKKVKFEFEFIYQSSSPITKDIADLIAEAMYKAGVKINPVGYDINTCSQLASTHDFDMVMFGFGASAAPDDFKQLWHSESWTTNGSNFSGFGNASTDALIDSIRYELDETKRIPMVKRFQKVVYDECPVIFMPSTYRKIVIHKRFGNPFMYFERPGVNLANLKLISTGVIKPEVNAEL